MQGGGEKGTKKLGYLLLSSPFSDSTSTSTISPEHELDLFNGSPVVVYACEAWGDFAATYISAGLGRQLGWTPEEFLSQPNFWVDHIHPDDQERVFGGIPALFETGRHIHEYRFQHKDGTYRWMRDELRLDYDGDGAPTQIVGYWLDITKRKQAEEVASEREAMLSLVTDNVPAIIGLIGRDERIRFANRRFAEWFRREPGDLIGAHLRDVRGHDAYEKSRPQIKRVFDGEAVSYEGERRVGDEIRYFQATYIPHLGDTGSVEGYVALVHDISEQRRAADALRASEERYRDLIEGSTLGIQIASREGNRLFANEALAWMTGYDSVKEMFALPPSSLVAPHDRERLKTYRVRFFNEEDVPHSYEFDCLRKDGTTVPLQAVTRRILWDGEEAIQRTFIDLTERKRAEEQLLQAQKMEAVGQLTGGVAHDFNNLLTVILGNLQLLESQVGNSGAASRYVRAATRAVLNGAELSQRLLSFSRRQQLAPKLIDLNDLVSRMNELLHRTLGESITIETSYADGLPAAMVDPGQLENAILNLAINARDAMPQGGRLTIETGISSHNDSHPWTADGMAPGSYVVVTIGDTGVGMAPEVLEHVFEPFFTTKEAGAGSGLGLSMVFGFARQSEGCLEIDSVPGVGTTVRLYFPAASANAQAIAAAPAHCEVPHGSETILVLEDDPEVRNIAVIALESLGYRVVETGNGASALEILEGDAEIDLLFTDIVLPGGMNGFKAAEIARQRRSGLRVAFTSGYSKGAGWPVHDAPVCVQADVLRKPYSQEELAFCIRNALDREED